VGSKHDAMNGSPKAFMKSMHKYKFSPKGKNNKGQKDAPGDGLKFNKTIFHFRHQTITESASQTKLMKLSSVQTPTQHGVIHQSMDFSSSQLKNSINLKAPLLSGIHLFHLTF